MSEFTAKFIEIALCIVGLAISAWTFVALGDFMVVHQRLPMGGGELLNWWFGLG